MPAAPVLVAEVLSPSTRREDLVRKAPEYLEAGIEVLDRRPAGERGVVPLEREDIVGSRAPST